MQNIFEGVQFLGVVNEFSIKDIFSKLIKNKKNKQSKPDKKQSEVASKPDPMYAHCKKYSNEFSDDIEKAMKDLITKHKSKLAKILEDELNKFDGNKDAFKLFKDSIDNINLCAYWDGNKEYYVNDHISYNILYANPSQFDPESKRWEYTKINTKAWDFLSKLCDLASDYFNNEVGVKTFPFFEGDWDTAYGAIYVNVNDLAKLYGIEEK